MKEKTRLIICNPVEPLKVNMISEKKINNIEYKKKKIKYLRLSNFGSNLIIKLSILNCFDTNERALISNVWKNKHKSIAIKTLLVIKKTSQFSGSTWMF